MPVSADFKVYILELLAPLGKLGNLHAKRMFGGAGLFLDERMFALLIDDTLYLKADDHNRAAYLARGMAPFVYDRQGKEVALSYYAVPPESLEDQADLLTLARLSVEAALRAPPSGRKRA